MIDKIDITKEGFIDYKSLQNLVEWVTHDLALEVLTLFSDTPGPSQIASWTKGPIVSKFISDWKLENVFWDPNFKGTGNGILRIGDNPDPQIWILAHWDTISFLIGPEVDGKYELIPFHHHLKMNGSERGLVLRYNLIEKKYTVISNGTIYGGEVPHFRPDDPIKLRSGDRIVYHTPVKKVKDSTYEGQFDNSPGCAGALLAAAILCKIPGISALICFVDEEEGPVVVGNTAFARGSRRLLHHTTPPKIAIAVDLHTVAHGNENPHLGHGALYKEFASQTSGGVTPPWLYESVRELAKSHLPNISLNENIYANVSRSDCVSIMDLTPNIILCGPPTVGRHYINGPYLCSTNDIIHLGRSLAMIVQHFQKSIIKE